MDGWLSGKQLDEQLAVELALGMEGVVVRRLSDQALAILENLLVQQRLILMLEMAALIMVSM